jgi:hypothetical protein
MQKKTKLIITIIYVVSSFSLFITVAFGQNYVNNTANTGDHSSMQTFGNYPKYTSPSIDSNNGDKEIDNLINQIGTAAKKIALGGANVLSNISGEIKKGLE